LAESVLAERRLGDRLFDVAIELLQQSNAPGAFRWRQEQRDVDVHRAARNGPVVQGDCPAESIIAAGGVEAGGELFGDLGGIQLGRRVLLESSGMLS
jgi:hypothetical protein